MSLGGTRRIRIPTKPKMLTATPANLAANPLSLILAKSGKITKEGSRTTGLVEGTPVAAGGMDIDLTALGCGCLDQGQMCIIVGTWSINGIIVEKPVIHPEVIITSSYCVPNRWYICDASPSSATNLDWFVDQFCHRKKRRRKKEVYHPSTL